MKKAYIKYILALLLFGSNGIVAGYIALNSYEIVFLRTLIGSLFLLVVFVISRQGFHIRTRKKDFCYLILSGFAMGASWMFLYEAYNQIGVSVATLAYYCGPVLVMALAPLVFREPVSRVKWLGFLAVLAGMYLVNRQELQQGGFSWGLLCGILAAVMYAVMVISNKKASKITGLENALYQLFFSFVAVALFTLFRQGRLPVMASGNLLPVLLLGIVNTGVGCYLYFSAIPRLPAQSVAICGYLEPVSALVLSALFLHERLLLPQLLGMVLILGGAAFGELFRPYKKGE